MKITFRQRPIYRAPISVLEHLYYYTVQYGLSVKQFTGAHWRYWEALPGRLRKAQHSSEELDNIIRELEKLTLGSEQRLQARRSQIKEGKWAQKEIVLNAQLLSVLAALPDDFLAVGFKNLTRDPDLPNQLHIVDLVIDGEKGEDIDFVEPDLLLLGDGHLLMVEVKTRGGASSSRSYPPHQLLNYLQLVLECQNSSDHSAPRSFTHLILVPSNETRWLAGYSQWVLETSDEEGRLRVNSGALTRCAKKKSSYDYEDLGALAAQVPIYYRSWPQLHDSFRTAAKQFRDTRNYAHWTKIMDEIEEISKVASRFA